MAGREVAANVMLYTDEPPSWSFFRAEIQGCENFYGAGHEVSRTACVIMSIFAVHRNL